MLLRQAKNLSPSPVPRGSPKRGGGPESPPSRFGKGAGGLGLRPAATLTEVLVAIFIMGIGLLALLSLFPLGALSMAQAIKDDRTAHAAKNAFSILELLNLHNDVNLYPVSATITDAFLNPYPVPGVGLTPVGMPPQIDPTKPSYPVYVDPYAFYFLNSQLLLLPNNMNSALVGVTVGNIGNPNIVPRNGFPGVGIPRRSPNFLTTYPTPTNPVPALGTIRWFTLLDDIRFQDDALPYPAGFAPGSVPVLRDNRYSWAYMLRRPKSGDPTVVDVSVVLYSGRSLSVLGETAFSLGADPATLAPTQGVRFDPSLKYVDVSFPVGQAPAVRRGSWILDATVVVPTNPPQPDPHGFFYRVVEVTDLGTLGSGINGLRLELQTNPKAASYIPVPPGNPPIHYGVLIVMENVVEVFDKGQGWKP